MMKTKLQTIPGGVPTGTEYSRMGGTMPSVASLPKGQELPYLNGAPAGSSPLGAADTMDMPLFTPQGGNTDTGVGHSGDLGGAGK